ncbi:MAG: S8 family serine peptidase [Ignavibacteria bacterium]|nr:S8 family serine peptidase [Ignavibacteria bacterium]
MKTRALFFIALAVLFASCTEESRLNSPVSPPSGGQDPTFAKTAAADIDLTNRYIVVFKKYIADPDALTGELQRTANGVQVHFRYRFALKGFAATIPPQALEGIKRNPNVDFIEPDGIATINGSQTNPPSWGLDRVDQTALPLNQVYNYPNDGTDVDVYIIDTGIRADHQEYNGRVSSGWDFIDNDNNTADCQGHGTHVAGTVGGVTTGIAKNVHLIGVRVLNCSGSGTWSQVIAGIDWVTANHNGPSVANMSLGGGYSASVNQAVATSVASGVVYAVAAGNNGAVACNYSPASAPTALTVGATGSNDARASFSNYGSCVDLFAPGVGITSSTMTGTNTYASWNGTSMATPHVAGVAAIYLSANPTATPAQVMSALIGNATSGVLSGIGTGSPNLLLNNNVTGPPPPAPPAAPSNLTATTTSPTAITLNWNDNANNETGFTVERSTSSNSGFAWLATLGADATTYANSGLPQGTRYWYRVRAENANGSSAWSNTANATTWRQVHVDALSIASSRKNNGWIGSLTVTVRNASGQLQSGVTVTVSWSGGASGSRTAVTGSNGQCTISTSKLNNNVSSITMSVTNLSGTGFVYDSGTNTPNPPTLSVNKP